MQHRPASRRRDRFFGRGPSQDVGRDVEAAPHLQPPTTMGEAMQVGDGLEMVARQNASLPQKMRMNYMDLVQNVWHFHAVEWGGRCWFPSVLVIGGKNADDCGSYLYRV